ncbi:MAG: membrane protein insertion efficiency factor YidD [Chloroflexota bacterium]
MARDLVLGAIRLYQWTLAPLLPPSCRFTPSCSRYGYEAVQRYGAVRGVRMIVGRLLRCQPLAAGGYDPVR